MTTVYIDPKSNIQYSSFYIKGLNTVFGKQNVRFSSRYFQSLERSADENCYDHYMAFVLAEDKGSTNIIIDFRDKVLINEHAYDWCDKYAKINFNQGETASRFLPKMISIAPGFGIRIWNLPQTLVYCLSNFVKSKFSPKTSTKQYFADYLMQYLSRLPIDAYTSENEGLSAPDNNYIFFIATLWPHDNCLKTTNLQRKQFVDICKNKPNINFEGGFFADPNHPQYEEFKSLSFVKPYPIEAYVKKTRDSLLVFNTPSVHNCHGWKLGEFLAMGKAIISTPLSNQLPANLIHGSNIHFVSNPKELAEAVDIISRDKHYRQKLENGSKDYFANYVKPENVISHILNTKPASVKISMNQMNETTKPALG